MKGVFIFGTQFSMDAVSIKREKEREREGGR